jgi:hypothetical protein
VTAIRAARSFPICQKCFDWTPAALAMSQAQVLSSGLMIRQDFAEAVRPVFFRLSTKNSFTLPMAGRCFSLCFLDVSTA